MACSSDRANVFGLPIARMSSDKLLDRIAGWIGSGGPQRVICCVNAFSVVESQRNAEYRAALLASDILIADGWPVARMAETERIAGSDLMLLVARDERLRRKRHTILGSYGAAYAAAMRQFMELGEAEESILGPWIPEIPISADLLTIANTVPSDILWVGLGAPRQECWAITHRHELRTKVIIPIGAAIDFLAGKRRRAPGWVQKAGLEWAWRIWEEPRRWRRQLGAAVGFARLLLH